MLQRHPKSLTKIFQREQTAQDQRKWRYLIRKGTASYEAKRACGAEIKRKTQSQSQGSVLLEVPPICLGVCPVLSVFAVC